MRGSGLQTGKRVMDEQQATGGDTEPSRGWESPGQGWRGGGHPGRSSPPTWSTGTSTGTPCSSGTAGAPRVSVLGVRALYTSPSAEKHTGGAPRPTQTKATSQGLEGPVPASHSGAGAPPSAPRPCAFASVEAQGSVAYTSRGLRVSLSPQRSLEVTAMLCPPHHGAPGTAETQPELGWNKTRFHTRAVRGGSVTGQVRRQVRPL